MIIIFEKPVYVKCWTGEVDQIILYNDESMEFTVRCISSDEIRTHMTALNCRYLSFSPNHKYGEIDYDCIEYIISKGLKNLVNTPEKFRELLYPTKDNLNKLIEMLQKINNGDIPIDLYTDSSKIYISATDIVSDIVNLADNTLIVEGKCSWKNINILKNIGFDVFPIERDCFGWVVGGIRTNKGIIAFG